MNPNTRVYYQEVAMFDVLEYYVKGFRPPNDGTILQWDANYDPATRKVWLKLTVELPVPAEKNIITLNG